MPDSQLEGSVSNNKAIIDLSFCQVQHAYLLILMGDMGRRRGVSNWESQNPHPLPKPQRAAAPTCR